MTNLAAWLLSAALWLAASGAVAAQPTPMASDEQLDAMLARRDWPALGTALSNPADGHDLARSMQWLRGRIEAGGGPFLGFIYARDAWLVGNQLKVADPNSDLRVTAAIITLYTYEIVQLAGARCEDQTEPAHRIAQLLDAQKDTLAFAAQQTPATKTLMLNAAIALERRTAPMRDDDDLLCRPELANPAAAPQPGSALAAAPRLADKKTAQAREAALRARMQPALTKLLYP